MFIEKCTKINMINISSIMYDEHKKFIKKCYTVDSEWIPDYYNKIVKNIHLLFPIVPAHRWSMSTENIDWEMTDVFYFSKNIFTNKKSIMWNHD